MTGLARDRTSDCRVSHFVFFFGSSPVIQRPDTVTLPLPSLQHWQYPSPLKGLKPVTCKLWFILNSHTQLCTLSCNGNLEWDCSWYSPLLKNSNIALYSENLFHLVILNSSFFFLFFLNKCHDSLAGAMLGYCCQRKWDCSLPYLILHCQREFISICLARNYFFQVLPHCQHQISSNKAKRICETEDVLHIIPNLPVSTLQNLDYSVYALHGYFNTK